MKEGEQLLKAYAEHGDEGAFHQLVERYSRLVYSTALRQVGDSHAAEDITQLVFTHLARQARTLPAQAVISAWLYRDAVFSSSKYRRSLVRRRIREEEAARMTEQSNGNAEAAWEHVAPLLEEAMTHLGIRDRDAIVLRYFEGQPFGSVGAALGIAEDAARMRVERALEKLRRFFVERGVTISAAGLASMLANDAPGSVPPGTVISSAATTALQNANAPPLAGSAWLSSTVLKFGLAGVLLLGLGTVLVWQSQLRAKSTRPSVLQADENPSIQIKGGIRRTTSNPPAMYFWSFNAINARPGERVAVTNVRSNSRLVARATVADNRIKIESSLFENASDPSAPAIHFPTITVTNGQSSVVSNGVYAFEFTTTFASPSR